MYIIENYLRKDIIGEESDWIMIIYNIYNLMFITLKGIKILFLLYLKERLIIIGRKAQVIKVWV
jgi:hypothetical protein